MLTNRRFVAATLSTIIGVAALLLGAAPASASAEDCDVNPWDCGRPSVTVLDVNPWD